MRNLPRLWSLSIDRDSMPSNLFIPSLQSGGEVIKITDNRKYLMYSVNNQLKGREWNNNDRVKLTVTHQTKPTIEATVWVEKTWLKILFSESSCSAASSISDCCRRRMADDGRYPSKPISFWIISQKIILSTNRRVASYFVVCGLPSQGEQTQLDEYSLEVKIYFVCFFVCL